MSAPGRRFAISDIHGCGKTFRHLVKKKIELTKSDQLFILGDLIDRGPNNKLVFDYIFKLQEKGYQVTPIMGNHEEMLISSLKDPAIAKGWINKNGGDTTLKSFKVKTPGRIPEKYLEFIHDLPYFIKLDNYLLVHAGFNFNIPDIYQDKRSMVWIRGYEPDMKKTGGREIVHGHTPTSIKKIRKMIKNEMGRYNIDNGCAYSFKGMGGLIALNLDTKEIIRQKNIE